MVPPVWMYVLKRHKSRCFGFCGEEVSLKVAQTTDELLVMKQPWHTCSNRWDERWRGSVRKPALGYGQRKQGKKKTSFNSSLVFSPSQRCVALGAQGHLKFKKKKNREKTTFRGLKTNSLYLQEAKVWNKLISLSC